MQERYQTLRLILGDQLNSNHPWYEEKQANTLYVMMETKSEATYTNHHIQKIIGFFLAMRAFAKQLENEGHQVLYIKLDDQDNKHSISSNLLYLIQKYNIEHFEYQLPDEYRLDEELKLFCQQLSITAQHIDTAHFLTSRAGVATFFKGKKTYILEYFYRNVRKHYNLLMEQDGKTPLTGKWNYDQNNRKKLPKKIEIPPALHFRQEVGALVTMVNDQGIKTIGHIDEEDFSWPVTRAESLQLLDHFAQYQLANFGTYQDAMTTRHYLLFHSKLSFALNTKMLSPLEVVKRCIRQWEMQPDRIDIAQIEGFVRQIVGWREYMRGIYWAKMPDYAQLNYFQHKKPLPQWFWTGETKMMCLKHAIGQSLDHAYAHHIQRLMVTGNFALLLGVHPDELDQWYLGIYMDAIEWVEITNTRGMSQFADGGIVGTKPYVSSANYIHKMSDYCGQCYYDRKLKYGPRACPFNSLYWDFYDRHTELLKNNPRVSMMYRTWAKMDGEEKVKILEQADTYKRGAEDL